MSPAVAREKRHRHAVERPREVRVGRRAEGRVQPFLLQARDRAKVVDAAASDEPDRVLAPLTPASSAPARWRSIASRTRSRQGQRVPADLARHDGVPPRRAPRAAKSASSRPSGSAAADRDRLGHDRRPRSAPRRGGAPRPTARACRSSSTAAGRTRGACASARPRRARPSGWRRSRPRTRCARWRCRPRGQHRHPGGADLARPGRRTRACDDLQVVDHEVEDDVDVEAARRSKTPSRWPSMKTGPATRARAPPRPPGCSARRGRPGGRARRARASATSASASASDAVDRLLDEHVESALEEEPGELGVAEPSAWRPRRPRPRAATSSGLDEHRRSPRRAPPRRRVPRCRSWTPTRVDARQSCAATRACWRPRWPTPTTARRTGRAPRHPRRQSHLMKPRSLVRMNWTSSSTSGCPASSAAIRSSAWLVLSFD